MNITVNKPVNINVKFLEIQFGDRVWPEDISIGNTEFEDWDDLFNAYPSLANGAGQLYLAIDVDTGYITNWPKGVSGCFVNVKVVDEGIYSLFDEEGELLHCYEGYVPSIFEIEGNGYGDYTMFNVIEQGYIVNWKATESKLLEIYNDGETDE